MDRFKRVKMPMLDPEKRKNNFQEVVLGYSKEDAISEAKRCLGCNVCRQGCPAGLKIADYIKAIAEEDFERAISIVLEDMPLPSSCGRICTRNCESFCVLGKKGDAVAIRWLKRAAADYTDYAKRPDDYVSIDDTLANKSVCIIGAGPAGLSAAYFLALRGANVVVYEQFPHAGGMLRVGIPRYRLPVDALEKDINMITSFGVEIRLNTRVGTDIGFDELKKSHDAIFIAIGYHSPKMMGIDGEDCDGVWHAIPFLREFNLGREIDVGNVAAVVGGGNTAMDVARTCIRLGAKTYVLYRRREEDMPADVEEIEEAKEEGVEIWTQTLPTKCLARDGRVYAVEYVKTKMVDVGEKRPKPVPIEDVKYTLEITTMVEAIGQRADYSFLPDYVLKDITITRGDQIEVSDAMMTGHRGVFAGGDIVNKKWDMVSAVADGKRAAEGIISYLMEK